MEPALSYTKLECISPVRLVPDGACAFMMEIIKSYLAWKGTYAPRASINYRIWLDRFIQICGNKKLEEYNVLDLVKYRTWLESKFSSCSVSFAIIVIKNFLQFCQTQSYPCLSPSLVRLPRINPKSHRAITESEFNKIISSLPTNEFRLLRDSLIIHMLWDTGVRVSELCDLDISQIDQGKFATSIQTKKTGKTRTIVWSQPTHDLLVKYMTLRIQFRNSSNNSALFVGWKKKGWSHRLTTRSVERIVKAHVESSGITEKITPHSFRHGWAHKRRDNNAPLAFIQKGLGHINPISTFVYEQYNDKEFEREARSYLKAA